MILFLPIKDDAILQTAWNVGTFATYVSIDDAQEISITFPSIYDQNRKDNGD